MTAREDLIAIAEDPKAFLRQSLLLEKQIKVKKRKIEHLQQISTQITTTIKAVSAYTGPSDKVGNCVIEILDLTDELSADVEAMTDRQRVIADAIRELVPDVTQRVILEAKYLAGMTWEEIAYSLHYAYRWTLRLHRRALTSMKENANAKI